ncbi:MAG TPA: molybdopterin-dependent oxidoreductase, partial [Candidatus Ozemobacteraceae bacterium]|nr:molybdopterin-dependent oxidoreductase [Candidatus Ozemobacteraceae bacterium]
GPTVASRTTFMSGNALVAAAQDLRSRLLPLAADLLGRQVKEVELRDGEAFVLADPSGKRISYQHLVQELYKRRMMPSAFGWYIAPDTSFDQSTGQGNAYFSYSFAATIAEVEVDVEIGEVRVTKVTTAHDLGKAINPQQVEGQIEGGTLQGVGYAITEEIRHDAQGKLLNDAFATYILPTTLDAPDVHAIICEHPYREGPYGAKGFGEVPLMGVAPAIANAVFNATGKRVRHMPMKPEKLV